MKKLSMILEEKETLIYDKKIVSGGISISGSVNEENANIIISELKKVIKDSEILNELSENLVINIEVGGK